jgi:hypothetical protein
MSVIAMREMHQAHETFDQTMKHHPRQGPDTQSGNLEGPGLMKADVVRKRAW